MANKVTTVLQGAKTDSLINVLLVIFHLLLSRENISDIETHVPINY